jgi:hypothetical protein
MREIIAGGLFSLALCGSALAGPITIDGGIATRNDAVRAVGEKQGSAPLVAGGVFFAFAHADKRRGPSGESGTPAGTPSRANHALEFTSVVLSATHTFVVVVGAQHAGDALAVHGVGAVRMLANDRLLANLVGFSSPQSGAAATIFTADGGALEPAFRLHMSDQDASHPASAGNIFWAGIPAR